MNFRRFIATLALVCSMTVGALGQSTYLPNPGKYGVSGWAINGQRVASQYNYYIDSIWGSGLGAYSFPPSVIYQAVPKGSQGFVGGTAGGPFNTNATVKIIDINSALTETVAFTSNSCTTGAGVSSVCTLTLANSNTHASYILRSGTCGLREALNDLGVSGGEVIIDQRFYDDGCTAATITGLTNAGGLQANQYVHDISNGFDTYYGIKGTSLTLTAAPTALTTAGGAAATLQTATTGGSISNGLKYRKIKISCSTRTRNCRAG